MPKINDRGVVQLVVLLILLAGLAGGLYLVSHPQIFKPKAAAKTIDWVAPETQDPNNCVTIQDGKKITTCTKVKFKVVAPGD